MVIKNKKVCKIKILFFYLKILTSLDKRLELIREKLNYY
jgi:hypothetical protein